MCRSMDLFYIVTLAFAVSLDSFMAGMIYGLKEITLPWSAVTIIGLVSTVATAAALFSAQICVLWISTHFAIMSGALILISLGMYSLSQEFLGSDYQIQPEQLDLDHSRFINPGEALLLGLALGIDNFTAVFAAALTHHLNWQVPIMMGLCQALLIILGSALAAAPFLYKLKKAFPYVPGLLLIVLGMSRLL